MISLQGKNILITGASSGIGRAIASLVGTVEPLNVIVCGRNVHKLEETINTINPRLKESNFLPFIGDFTDPQSISKLVSFINEKQLALDCIVYSAGIDKSMPFKLASEKIFSELLHINSVVPLETTRQLLKAGLIRNNASIVFISSVMGMLGQPGQIAYSASKGALISSSKGLALELSPLHIRVNVITPGIVQTSLTEKLFGALTPEGIEKIRKMHPLGLGEPEDVANLVLFLFSDKAKWITGSTLTIDGGYSAH